MLYALMTRASIDVGRVIFDHYMHSVRSKVRGIGFSSLVTSFCAWNGVTWAPNKEKVAPMKPIDEGLIVEFLGHVPPTKHYFATTGASCSSSVPRA